MRSILLVSLLASTAYALPPGADPALRQGANHHVGDDSFVALFGRAPTPEDDERVRMTAHLQYVHDYLASRPATKPELAAKRKALLDALQRYIAKGTTPQNANLPWRTPVFIDEEGTICAVGYLIESSAGRALPERIAKLHKYDFIEDIAASMPEVAQWVAESGLTLEEIASIQPAYDEPSVEGWRGWDLAKFKPADGPSTRYGQGNFKNRNMEGTWKVTGGETGQIVLGTGELTQGKGAWTSFYPTGEKMAEGRYDANQPEGRWRIYHKSGNVAAEGALSAGMRVGKWRFYYDTAAKTPMAVGRFGADGSVIGRWQHFDPDGKLLARTWTETPTQWADDSIGTNGGEGFVLEVAPGADGVRHSVHQGTPGKDVEYNELKLELFAKGKEKLYISTTYGAETWYGADGVKLIHDEAGWRGTDCRWSTTRKQIAQQGDIARLDGVLSNDAMRRARDKQDNEWDQMQDTGVVCRGAAVAIGKARAARLDALLASRETVRSATPAMVRDLILDQEDQAEPDEDLSDDEKAYRAERQKRTGDLARILSGSMVMYIEWPHIDRRFTELYATMAGRYMKHWASRSDDDGDPNLVESVN
jgi:antitoxin component YwqK of YwqJK toxin-antitoxin module